MGKSAPAAISEFPSLSASITWDRFISTAKTGNCRIWMCWLVNKETGEPGAAIPIPRADIQDETRRVFRHDWEKEKLPTLEEIETTYRHANMNDDGSDL